MAGSLGGCGCGPAGAGGYYAPGAPPVPETDAANTQSFQGMLAGQSPQQTARSASAQPTYPASAPGPAQYGSVGVTPEGQVGKGVGPGIRDRARAQQSLAQIQQAVARFADFSAATSLGYKRNPASGYDKVQHYINDEFNRAGNNDNVANPATLLYDQSVAPSRLVGVMLSADPNRPLPDFGAGAWHRHPGDDNVHMHIWFDRSLDDGAFENNTGYI